jgi:hypothetical protein
MVRVGSALARVSLVLVPTFCAVNPAAAPADRVATGLVRMETR